MKLYFVNILFALIWMAMTGTFSLLNMVFGFCLGTLALALVRDEIGSLGYLARARRVMSLVLLFVWELGLSGWRVAVLVIRPNLNLRPGIFAFPLTVDRDFEITLLANLITLTPGTLSVDVSADRRVLYVHAIDCADPDASRHEIAAGFEKKILEAFR